MELERLSTVTAKQREVVGLHDSVRWLQALHHAGGRETQAAEWFLYRWPRTLAAPVVRKALDDGSLFTKSAMVPADTLTPGWAGNLARPTWLDPLVTAMQKDSVLARGGFTPAPLNVPIGIVTGEPSLVWVGQSQPKPVSQLTTATVTLQIAKGGSIEVLTRELMEVSDGAERVIANRLIAASTRFVDTQFLDPAVAATPDRNPASILNGRTAVPTGATVDVSIAALIAQFFTQRPNALAATFLVSPSGAAKIAATGNHDGVNVTANGMINGIESVVTVGAANLLVLVDPTGIYYSDLGAEIDVSQYAAVIMDSAPVATAATVVRDLWAHDEVGLRVDRWCTWVAEPNAVAFVSLP